MTPAERAYWVLAKIANLPYATVEQHRDLIRREIEAAVAEEREACAKLADLEAAFFLTNHDMARVAERIAAAIRAGGTS